MAESNIDDTDIRFLSKPQKLQLLNLLAGINAGVVSCVVCSPLDIIKVSLIYPIN